MEIDINFLFAFNWSHNDAWISYFSYLRLVKTNILLFVYFCLSSVFDVLVCKESLAVEEQFTKHENFETRVVSLGTLFWVQAPEDIEFP